MTDTFAGELVKSVSIDNMLNQREAVVAKIDAAFVLMREAMELAEAAHIGFPRFRLNDSKYDLYSAVGERQADFEHSIRKVIDRTAWQYLMSESGMKTFMHSDARAQWDKSIEKGEFPELTRANIEATFADLYGARSAMFDEGVIKVFRQLSWHYHTNKPFKFGKRIIIRFLRSSVSGHGGSLGSPNYEQANRLDDLVRVLSVLDGKPEPDHREGWYSRLSLAYKTDADGQLDDAYISVKSFRNGNGHVTFKRPDLVEKMNEILTRHHPDALPHDHHT